MKTLVEGLGVAGGKYWSKGDHERIYFNIKEAYALAGGKVQMYVSGRVESASLPTLGRVSNSKAFVKAYYDLVKDEVVVNGRDSEVEEVIKQALEALITEIKSKEEEAKKEEVYEASPETDHETETAHERVLSVEILIKLEESEGKYIEGKFPLNSNSSQKFENASHNISKLILKNMDETGAVGQDFKISIIFSAFQDSKGDAIRSFIQLNFNAPKSSHEILAALDSALSKSIEDYYDKYSYPL